MLKLGRVICFCLAFAGCLRAQQSQPKLTAADLQHWLRSGDPGQIAWAAHYVAENGEAYPGTLAVMAEVLDKERTSADSNALAPAASQHDHYEAVAALLDAFIQQKAPPSTGIIATIANTFPTQAILLASYLPQTEKNSLLEYFYSFRHYDANGRLLARIATMMSADNPPPALAASLVNEAEEHLTVIVRKAPKVVNPAGAGGACGDSLTTAIRPNWPVVYTYQFEENATGARDALLVAMDDDRITYRRVPDNEPGGSCNGVRWLDAGTRHRLIAHWLGIPDRSMVWSTQSVAVIIWTTRRAYLAKLAESIEKDHQALQATVNALVAKHIFDGLQAASVQPQLVLSFACEMDPCPIGGGSTQSPALDSLGRD